MHYYFFYFLGSFEIQGIVVAFKLVQKIVDDVGRLPLLAPVEGKVEGNQLMGVFVEGKKVIVCRYRWEIHVVKCLSCVYFPQFYCIMLFEVAVFSFSNPNQPISPLQNYILAEFVFLYLR